MNQRYQVRTVVVGWEIYWLGRMTASLNLYAQTRLCSDMTPHRLSTYPFCIRNHLNHSISFPDIEEKTAEPEGVVENAPEPVEEDPEAEDESEVEVSQGLSQQDQDVFKALDEADGVDDGPQDRAPVPVKPKKKAKKAKDKPKSGSICKRIFCFFLWLVCAGGAAVILSFYFLDYPEGFWRSSGPAPAVTESPTMSPTIALSHAPTTLQWGQFLESFLIPISGEEVFMDKNSPQYRAGKYILDDPYTAEVSTTGRLNDRYASITFYFATGGENWNSCYYGDENCDSGQWLEGDVCDWNAVSCDDEGRIVSYLFGTL